MTRTESSQGARVRVTPPAVYLVPLLVTLALHYWVSLTVPGGRTVQIIGAVVFFVGMALLGNAALGMLLRRTTLIPHRPVSHLVTGGVYRITRNPIYVGFAGVYLGVGLAARSWWTLFLLPAIVITIHCLVIRPEEAYLRDRFGQDYVSYCERVRRWL